MKTKLMKKFISLFTVASIAISALPNVNAVTNAEDLEPSYNDSVVIQTISENKSGFAIGVGSQSAEGSSVTVTQEAVAFDYNYLAIRFVSTFVDGDDKFRPIKVFVNGAQIVGVDDYAQLAAYAPDGTQMNDVELKWGGYLFLEPSFDGTVYFPKALLGEITEITSLKVSFDAGRGGELVITDVLGCNSEGAQVGVPVVNEKNLTVETANGVTVEDGLKVKYPVAGANPGVVTLNFDEQAFTGEYLALDITVDEVLVDDPHLVFELYVNDSSDPVGKATDNDDVITVFNRNYNEETANYNAIENKWPYWHFVPSSFDGIIYYPKALISAETISSLKFVIDNYHAVNFTINNVFSCATESSTIQPTAGTLFTAEEGATINATTASNTAQSTCSFTTADTLPLQNDKYVAVYLKMKECNVTEDFTYINFYVNDKVVFEQAPQSDGTFSSIDAFIAGSDEGVRFECKWGNWIVIPSEFEGTIYLPVSTYFEGETKLHSFKFGFDGGHTQVLDYKVGVASTLGGEVTWLDLSVEAEKVGVLMNGATYKAPRLDVLEVIDFEALTAEDGIITDSKVSADEGITVFNTFSYSYQKFGGISLEESWENQLVIGVKSAFEGGVPLNPTDNGCDYGFLELEVDEAFELASGLALNVQCLSIECYFRVLIMDEEGGIWTADHAATDYTFTSEGVPLGMATLFNNFYFGEDTFGTLYIPKDHFSAATEFSGVEITPDDELGKVKKIIIGLDHLYGLGRSICLGSIANVDVENNLFTRVINPVEMTDEELGIGTAKGTKVYCSGSDAHVANFKISREILEDTPGYEPSAKNDPDTSDSSSSSTTGGKDDKDNGNGCKNSLTSSSLLCLLAIATGVVIKKKHK